MNLREGSVQAAILAYLGQRGDCFFWRANTGGMKQGDSFVRFGVKGQSDILGVLAPYGKMLAIECKRPVGGRLSSDQQRFGDAVVAAGGIFVVARSVDDVERALGPVTYPILFPKPRRVYPR